MFFAKKFIGGIIDVVRWVSAQNSLCVCEWERVGCASHLSSLLDPLFVATSTQPSLCPLTLWVDIRDITLSVWHPTCQLWRIKWTVCVCVPQPPPRRPNVYAEQYESDEEKQFRRVFQQLAGDVSVLLTFNVVYCCLHIDTTSTVECLSLRTWKWAPTSWWTSWTESLESVRHFWSASVHCDSCIQFTLLTNKIQFGICVLWRSTSL